MNILTTRADSFLYKRGPDFLSRVFYFEILIFWFGFSGCYELKNKKIVSMDYVANSIHNYRII